MDSLFVVVDKLTGDIVYRTTYRHRNRARRWADRKDLEYGAVRYVCKRLPFIADQHARTNPPA